MRKGKTMKMFLAVLALAAALLPMPVLADTGDVASAGEIANAREIGKYGMLPVYGQDIADGTYHVTSQSSSAFFRITDAQMTAEDGHDHPVEPQLPVRLSGNGRGSRSCRYIGLHSFCG